MKESKINKIKQILKMNGEEQETQYEKRQQMVVLGSVRSGANHIAQNVEVALDEASVDHLDTKIVNDVAKIESMILGIDPKDEDKRPTIPMGVILMSQMRQYNMLNGNGMSISTTEDQNGSGMTVYDIVKNLCDQYEIPFEYIDDPAEEAEAVPALIGKVVVESSE